MSIHRFKEISVSEQYLHQMIKDYGSDKFLSLEPDSENCFLSRKSKEMLFFKIKETLEKEFKPRQIGIFHKYYFESWKQELIAEFYEISQPAVSRMIKRMIPKVEETVKKWEFLL